MEREMFYAEDIIQSVKNLSTVITDDCTWSGVLELAAEILGGSPDTIQEIVDSIDE